jgi:hypothetical protein
MVAFASASEKDGNNGTEGQEHMLVASNMAFEVMAVSKLAAVEMMSTPICFPSNCSAGCFLSFFAYEGQA